MCRPYGSASPDRAGEDTRPYGVSITSGRGTPQGGFSCPFGAIHLQPLPYGIYECFPIPGRGGPWASRRRVCKPRGHPHPSGLRPATFPLQGGRLFGRRIAAPTVHRKPVGAHSMRPPEFAPGALVRKRQARERNRARPNFPPTQAPSGAGRDRTQALLILRAGRILTTPRGNPRNGVRGKATMSTKCSSGAVPGGVLVTLPPWAK